MLSATGERVIIKPHKENKERETKGGILVPQTAQMHNPNRSGILGTVIARGEGKMLDSGMLYRVPLEVGQVVYYPSFGGIEIMHEHEDYIVHNQEDIVAVVK